MSNDIEKSTKKTILIDLCNTPEKKKQEINKQGDDLPYGFYAKYIAGVRSVCPSITYHNVNNELRRR